MINHSHIDQSQCFFQALGDAPVGVTGLWIATGVVGEPESRRRRCGQRLLDHFAGVHAGSIDGAPEQLIEADHMQEGNMMDEVSTWKL